MNLSDPKPLDIFQAKMDPTSRAKLTRLVYATLLLIATSGLCYFLETGYSMRLMSEHRYSLAQKIEEYFPPSQFLFLGVQLLVVLIYLHPFRTMSDFRAAWCPIGRAFRSIWVGLFAGVATLLLTSPTVFGIHRPSGIVTSLANHMLTASGLGVLLFLVLVLPLLEAIFFQGVLLRQLLEGISVTSALLVSTLVFMISWPSFNFIAAAAISLATGIVYLRTRTILACAVSYASFTIGAIIVQFWRLP
jgi:membrane protease YdiL (CAAX protease family)